MSHGTAIDAIADNLANTNTPGFKAQRAEFSNLLAESLGSLYGSPLSGGDGVFISDVSSIHLQGPVDFTNRDLDVAVSGLGYFILSDGTNSFYTRAGNFDTNAEGNLVASSGETVMGFTAASPETLVPINITNVAATAQASTAGNITGNLDATAPLTAPVETTFNALNQSASFRSSIGVIDSLGERHDIGLYFFRTGNGAWTASAYVDGADVGGTAGTPTQVGTTTLAFDATGSQGEGATTALTISAAWANGAAGSSVALGMGELTGFSAASGIASVTMDGVTPGNVVGVEVDKDGNVLAQLDNGTSTEVAELALATFNNPGGLQKIGNNKFIEAADSGTAAAGKANVDGKGYLQGGALELSTVDPANELIQLIAYQRGYQAGAQVITTASELINTTIQLA